jgi:hypothetical protein
MVMLLAGLDTGAALGEVSKALVGLLAGARVAMERTLVG